MRKKRVLIMIDSATRDGLSQLLVAHYLKQKGVKVLLCSQITLVGMCERYRPDVLFVSWTSSKSVGAYLLSIRHKTRIVLVDQEGGRMGEEAFKRNMLAQNRVRVDIAHAATRIIAWGPLQAEWLKELNCIAKERIVVTGCPRFDPYLIPEEAPKVTEKYVGVTMRADLLTSLPLKLMERIFDSLFIDPKDGLTPGLPLRAHYEDWLWQHVAVARHQFKIILELSKRTNVPVVMRPAPWEQRHVYDFMTRHLRHVLIRGAELQHQYVKNAFVTIDASSALGLESLLVGIPVISVNALVPRLEEHVGGEGGTRFNAPYRRFYWHPKTVEEAVEYVLKAEKGELAFTPSPDSLKQYFNGYLGWPGSRPASFNIGDVLLELLDLPASSHLDPCDVGPTDTITKLKRSVYRFPGSAHLAKVIYLMKHLVFSAEREFFKRYAYFDWLYPHHHEISKIFTSLWKMYEEPAVTSSVVKR